MRSVILGRIRRISLIIIISLSMSSIGFSQHHHKQKKHRHGQQSELISIVTSLPSYASIARDIGGDLVTVEHIVAGNQDPHFVQPKPSYALMLRDADLFVTTGLDLELWVPTLIDKARNKKVFEGGVGYVSVATDIPLLEKPQANPDRSMGDVHVYGNPHIQTSPLNAKIIAENILIGLKKVSPGNTDTFEVNYRKFVDHIDRQLFGDELVEMFGGEVLCDLLRSGKLIDFLETKKYGGEKLIDKLGGWLKMGLPFRGKKIIAYHKNWIYFARDFGLEIMDYIEPKPGIPPTAKHVKEVIEKIQNQNVKVMMVANYFEKNSPQMISERTGIRAVFIPLDVDPELGVNTYFDLINNWIEQLNEAFESNI
jgi:zinc/manganese transport system substrate-binding protein